MSLFARWHYVPEWRKWTTIGDACAKATTALMSQNPFQRTRDDHSREKAEDYVELIDDLIRDTGEARAVDLADRLGISHVSVSKTIQRLQKEGYVKSQPYRSIFLTDEGKRLADEARARHALVHDFLVALGVSEATAESDAEGIEHHVSEETLAAMRRYLDSSQRR
jgi:DtxR family transcriptional regulator, manganese transport regulator